MLKIAFSLLLDFHHYLRKQYQGPQLPEQGRGRDCLVRIGPSYEILEFLSRMDLVAILRFLLIVGAAGDMECQTNSQAG